MAIALDSVEAALGAARVIVVTSRRGRAGFAALGAEVVVDAGGGLVAACRQGIAAAGAGPVAVMLGDVPALRAIRAGGSRSSARSRHPLAFVAGRRGRRHGADHGARPEPTLAGVRCALARRRISPRAMSNSTYPPDVGPAARRRHGRAARRDSRRIAWAREPAALPASVAAIRAFPEWRLPQFGPSGPGGSSAGPRRAHTLCE